MTIFFEKIVRKLLVERNMTQKWLAESIEIDPVTLNRYIKKGEGGRFPSRHCTKWRIFST